jgi:DNA-binding HxlR family transcriptional regulator
VIEVPYGYRPATMSGSTEWEDLYARGSPTRELIGRLANRWTILILRALQDGPTRFTELRDRVGISSQVLTRSLRDLEQNGLVERRAFAEVPVRVEYSLTDVGRTLCPIIDAMRKWAEDHQEDVAKARARYERVHRRPERSA